MIKNPVESGWNPLTASKVFGGIVFVDFARPVDHLFHNAAGFGAFFCFAMFVGPCPIGNKVDFFGAGFADFSKGLSGAVGAIEDDKRHGNCKLFGHIIFQVEVFGV